MLLLQIDIFKKLMYSRSYESVYNLADKSFEISFKKHMLFIKQYELFQRKIPINGGGMYNFHCFM